MQRFPFAVIYLVSKNQKARMAYEAREAELMDQRTRVTSALVKGEEIGIKKGKEEGKEEIIHAMLRGGMSVDEVAAMTGMEIKEVEQFQKGNVP